MKIAYLLVDPAVGLFGTTGASVRVQEMIRAFQAHGHDVTVFCLTRQDRPEEASGTAPGLEPADLRDLPVVTVPVEVPRSPVQPAEAEDSPPTGSGGAGEESAADARREAVGRAAAQLASRAAEEAVPFDLIYERCSMFSDAGARVKQQLTAAGHSARLVMELDAPLVEERTDATTSCWSPTVRALTAADLITCASSSLARWAGELLAGDGSDAADEREEQDEQGAERGSAAAQAAASRLAVVPHGVKTGSSLPTATRRLRSPSDWSARWTPATTSTCCCARWPRRPTRGAATGCWRSSAAARRWSSFRFAPRSSTSTVR